MQYLQCGEQTVGQMGHMTEATPPQTPHPSLLAPGDQPSGFPKHDPPHEQLGWELVEASAGVQQAAMTMTTLGGSTLDIGNFDLQISTVRLCFMLLTLAIRKCVDVVGLSQIGGGQL